MRFLMYGDLHVNHGKATYTDFLKKTVDFLIDTIHERQPDVLVNCGDTLDTFGTQNVKDVVLARDIIRRLTNAIDPGMHYVMRGNHDTGDKHGEDTWTDVLEMEGVEIINKTTVRSIYGKNYLFVPYTRDFDIDTFKPDCHIDAAFAHTDWIGCRLTPKHISTSGFVPAEVAEVIPGVPVFAGHYHSPMQAGPVHFVGSPLYMTFNDEVTETPRGFTFWDTEGSFPPDSYERKDGTLKMETLDDTDYLCKLKEAPGAERIENPHTYLCHTVTADTAPQLKKARKDIGEDADRTRVRVFTRRRLIDKAEEIFEDCLWSGIYPQDDEKTEVTFGTKVALQATPMEIVDQATEIAPEDLTKELVRSTGRQAFHVR